MCKSKGPKAQWIEHWHCWWWAASILFFSFQNLQRFKCLHRTEPDLRFAPWAPNTVSQWQWGSLEERNFVFFWNMGYLMIWWIWCKTKLTWLDWLVISFKLQVSSFNFAKAKRCAMKGSTRPRIRLALESWPSTRELRIFASLSFVWPCEQHEHLFMGEVGSTQQAQAMGNIAQFQKMMCPSRDTMWTWTCAFHYFIFFSNHCYSQRLSILWATQGFSHVATSLRTCNQLGGLVCWRCSHRNISSWKFVEAVSWFLVPGI